jgi:Ca2+-binding EF-hand superfamily protein
MAPEVELVTKVKRLLQARSGRDDIAALREGFEAYDVNRTGCLEPEELQRVLEDADIGNKFTRGMWVKGILARLDRDRDNALSWDDFAQVLDAA